MPSPVSPSHCPSLPFATLVPFTSAVVAKAPSPPRGEARSFAAGKAFARERACVFAPGRGSVGRPRHHCSPRSFHRRGAARRPRAWVFRDTIMLDHLARAASGRSGSSFTRYSIRSRTPATKPPDASICADAQWGIAGALHIEINILRNK